MEKGLYREQNGPITATCDPGIPLRVSKLVTSFRFGGMLLTFQNGGNMARFLPDPACNPASQDSRCNALLACTWVTLSATGE